MIVNAVVVDVGEYAEIKQISTSSAFLKAELGASTYEMIYPFEDKSIAVIINENAPVEGSRFCRALYESDGETIKSIIQGKFIVVKTDENNICSLSEEEKQKYLDLFYLPEKFFFDGEVVAFKYKPDETKDSTMNRLIGGIWDSTFTPQKFAPSEEYDNKRRQINRTLQEMLCILPTSMHDQFDAFLEASSELFNFEKKSAFQNGVNFGRQMFNGTQ